MPGTKKSKETTAQKARANRVLPRKTAPKWPTTRKVKEPTRKNLDVYGAAPVPWSRALKELEGGTGGTFWLATTNPDGRPHVAGVGALWVDSKIYFVTGARTRKGRNLAAHADCASRSPALISSSRAPRSPDTAGEVGGTVERREDVPGATAEAAAARESQARYPGHKRCPSLIQTCGRG